MVWALALVVVIGVGLPMIAWFIARRLPPPRRVVGRLGVGYDGIDRWLLDRYHLAPQDRWRVRKAVFSGRRISDPGLARAAHGLAAQAVSGGFRVLRLSRVFGWVDLMAAIGFAGFGIFLLSTSRHAGGLILGGLGLVNSALFGFPGVMRALVFPAQIRRNVVQALQLNEDDE